MGKQFTEGVFYFLRAQSGVAYGGISALVVWADFGNCLGVSANVTGEFLVLPMVCQRDAAIWAARHITAEGALQRSGVSAPVQEKDDLLFPLKPLSNPFLKLGRENGDY